MSQIAYIDRAKLEALGCLAQGIHAHPAQLLETLDALIEYGPRQALELDPSKKQLIPYVVLVSPDQKIFTMRRKATQAEARLHHKLSIGVGGHMEREDAHDERSAIMAALWRELKEEVCWEDEAQASLRFIGLINDDSTEVGQVHLGLCFICEGAPETITTREVEKMEGWWAQREWLETQREAMESWSALAIELLPSTRV